MLLSMKLQLPCPLMALHPEGQVCDCGAQRVPTHDCQAPQAVPEIRSQGWPNLAAEYAKAVELRHTVFEFPGLPLYPSRQAPHVSASKVQNARFRSAQLGDTLHRTVVRRDTANANA